MKAWEHLKTITKHKILVAKGCFRVGLFKQGILHDMSKLSYTEFRVGMKYYQGTRSPNNAEREDIGYSTSWLHHKGRNKHHFEYWIDYGLNESDGMIGMKMPKKYIVEMFMDRVAASKIYMQKDYTDDKPLIYYHRGRVYKMMHQETSELLETLLEMLAREGEEKTFQHIKKHVL